MNAASENPKKLAELLEFDSGERFSESVRNHIVGRAVEQGYMALRYRLTNKMEVDINVFRATVKCGIF